MSCVTNFVAGIQFQCIREIASEVRGGGASLATAKKIAWVAGCALEQFDGEGASIQSSIQSCEVPSTADGCVGRLLEIVNEPTTQAINPELIALLLKLAELIFRNFL